MPRLPREALVPMVLWFAVGCGDVEVPGDRVTVVDSVGVRVVSNHVAIDSLPLAVLAVRPTVRIGRLEGATEEQFVRVSGVVTLSDGSLAILDQGANALRVFGPDGVHLASFGSEGDGPEESRFPVGPWRLRGDSLLVWDLSLRRASVLTPSFGFVTSLTPAGTDPARPDAIGVALDSLLVMVARSPDTEYLQGAFGPDSTDLFMLSRSDGSFRHVGRHFVRDVGIESGVIISPLFAPIAVFSVVPNGVLYSTGGDSEIRRFDGSGSLIEVIRWMPPSPRPTDAIMGAYLDWRAGDRAGDARERRIAFDRSRVRAEVLPTVSDVRIGRDGRIWVERYRGPWESGPIEWFGIDRSGVLRLRLQVPSNLRVMEFGEDDLVGVERDDLDVERVVRYDLPRH